MNTSTAMWRESRMNRTTKIRARNIASLVGIASFMGLAACGGGGGGGAANAGGGVTPPTGPVASTATFQINSAITYLVDHGFQAAVTLSGDVNSVPVSGHGTYTWNQYLNATFEYQPALNASHVVTLTMLENNVSKNVSSVTQQFFSPTYAPFGQIDSATGATYRVTSFSGWPTAANVGDNGPLGTVTIFADSTRTTVAGHQQLSYAIEADTADTAIFDLKTVETDNTNNVVSQEDDRYRLMSTGIPNFVSSTVVHTDHSGTSHLVLTATAIQTPPPMPVPNPPTPLPVLHQSVSLQIDPAHSGHVAFGQPVSLPATPTWSINLGGGVSYPLIAGGKVFVTAANATPGTGTQLYALDEATGQIIWGPVAIPTISFNWSASAYDNGRLFVLSYDGYLQAFDAATGALLWAVFMPYQYIFDSPPTAVNGVVYVDGAFLGGDLYAVDENTGDVLWMQKLITGGESSPTVSNEGVFLAQECHVYDFDPVTGAMLWHSSRECDGGMGTTAVYGGGFLYAVDQGYDLVMAGIPPGEIFNTATGKLTASFTANPLPAIGDKTGYFMNSGTLNAIDLASQRVLWTFAGDGQLSQAPILIDQTVIVESDSGVVYALDATTGAQLWGGYAGSPVTHNGWQPSAGLGAGEGYLVVPAGNVLTAWRY